MLFHQSAPRRLIWPLTVEQLMLAAGLFWALTANRLFLAAALKERDFSQPATWGFAAALLVMLVAVNVLLLGLVCTRHTAKPVIGFLILGTAFASYYMQAYGVYLDPSMMRNVMRTDVAEARELFAWGMVPHFLLYAVLPLVLLWRVQIRPRPTLLRAAGMRAATLAGAVALALGALMLIFQPFASLMRNHKEIRYLATPSNYIWSIGSVVAAQAKGAAKPRQAIGLDAKPGPVAAARTRPLLVVLVVGETARAANWGLNGYARNTTPELAKLAAAEPASFASFAEVTSCGTNTEVSLPCMFAPVGRRDYDEAAVRGSESLLHVVARAGVHVLWRDNQSGCKGVCEGLPEEHMHDLKPAGLCAEGRCLDEALLAGLPERLAAVQREGGTHLLVLHMLGNHGPSYFRRYPPAFARFQPACNSDDLHKCAREEIVNAYDNALLYTDHVLAQLAAQLKAAGGIDSAMLYVSDHGESLGENNLYLHGLPYAIAPDVQKRVPMLMWFGAGTPRAMGLDVACLQKRAAQPAAHDHLFHTLLAMLDVKTSLYAPAWDLAAGCRAAP